ncbi:hypothetical protein PDQ75_24815 [Bacillus cereus group sp. Bc015]|uniref:hypothetical protein n=1 Tax=Bacillus cereus group sp. Bc015 TaxID=3018123 RepID=UPI0022E4FD57|nr:hypothetical protein [Bacillus cereus group sp. Bc015]MDA2738380.1 hypothetical protein [Bacillus cereus group sp. Bc015]
MIPLNQKVRVIFADSLNDEWGIPVKTPRSTTYKVRLDFNSDARIIEGDDGKNIIYSATIYFKGSVPISYNDFIEYDSGIKGLVTENPRVIFPITDLAGKVTYTKVLV